MENVELLEYIYYVYYLTNVVVVSMSNNIGHKISKLCRCSIVHNK